LLSIIILDKFAYDDPFKGFMGNFDHRRLNFTLGRLRVALFVG
jgi:hypothetical protein